MARPHVALVVDDDADLIQEVRNMLESLGHDCCCASTQEEAEQLLTSHAFCYLLLDLELPVRANQIPKIQVGFNLLERIRERFSRERLPVLIMTAHGQGHQYPTRAFKMGADDYIKKPFDSECEPFEDKIRSAMKRTCEKDYSECPNIEVLRRSEQNPGTSINQSDNDSKPVSAPVSALPLGILPQAGVTPVPERTRAISEFVQKHGCRVRDIQHAAGVHESDYYKWRAGKLPDHYAPCRDIERVLRAGLPKESGPANSSKATASP